MTVRGKGKVGSGYYNVILSVKICQKFFVALKKL